MTETMERYRKQTRDIVLKRLRLAINRSGRSVEEIAQEAGIPSRSLYTYTGTMRAQTCPAVVTLVRLAQVLGVSLDWLCGLEDEV